MQVLVVDEPHEAGSWVAARIVDGVRRRALNVLGVATGSSPLATYRALVAFATELSGLSAFALDEYVGLRPDHPESYRAVIDRELTQRLGLDRARVHAPNGTAADLDAAAAAYEAAIVAAGGVDLQLLGIGANGHIGFNEPGAAFTSRTRVTELAARTRADNARFFTAIADVPQQAITQGLGTIMEARSIILIAQGESKAAAVAAAIEGPRSESCPASVLQDHDQVTFVLDVAAASGLTKIEAVSGVR